MSKLFRGKVVAALDEAYQSGQLDLRGIEGFGPEVPNEVAWGRLKRKLYRTKWVSYAKPPFAGPDAVFRYLGQYTHRVGLSNHRLISATDDEVVFRTRGEHTASLHPHEFLRRFLLHVLPRGFVKLRHYGLLAPGNVNTKLAVALRLLTATVAASTPTPVPESILDPTAHQKSSDWRELLLRLTGLDLSRCPKCGGTIVSRAIERAPPKDTS
jgi:hypothetical protein